MKKYLILLLIVVVLSGMIFYGCGGSGSGGEGGYEVINGITVPPVPNAKEDAATIGGVDSNGNILRDKVERMLATEFGKDPELYKKAWDYALAEQVAIMNSTPENIATSNDLLSCSEDHMLDVFRKITDVTVDTQKRRNANAAAFAGTTLSDERC